MLITAQIARDQFDGKINTPIKNSHIRELRGIEAKINRASKNKNMSIIMTRISDVVKEELIRNGFRVRLHSNYDLEYYVISWGKET